jgi:hypothetical protein
VTAIVISAEHLDMPIIRFGGRILPHFVQINIADHPQIDWHDDEANLNMKFKISIQNGRIDIGCEIDRWDQASHLVRVYMRAFDLVRATVDVCAFSTGYGLSVILDSFTNVDGIRTPFISHDSSIGALCTAFTLAPASTVEANTFHKVLTIVLTDWRIFQTLRWLIEAITLPHESVVNCARTIEGIRHLLATPDVTRAEAWRQMRDKLNLSEAYLKLITDVSIGPRHGQPVHVQGGMTAEIIKRAWTIMNRFLEYKKDGDRPLDPSKFPLLIQ